MSSQCPRVRLLGVESRRGFELLFAICNALGCGPIGVSPVRPAAGATAAAGIAQAPPSREPTARIAAFDFSGIDAFWRVADVLARDSEPSRDDWQTLLTTADYLPMQVAARAAVQEDMELAFRPARRAAFDSVSRLASRSPRLTHFRRAAALRAELFAFRESLTGWRGIPSAVALAAKFLPPGAANVGDPPPVAFNLIRMDNYSLASGVAVDLLNAYHGNLVLILGHEFHHTYLNRANPTALPLLGQGPDGALRGILESLRNEGMADLIDKPYPLTSPDPERAEYVARYNDEYAHTPTTIHLLDSLLTLVAQDSTTTASIAQRVQMLLWSGGHPNGAYMARAIYEAFGVDSLFPGVTDPAAFLRTYAAVVQHRGGPPPFSSSAMGVMEKLERRFWRRR